VRGTEPRATTQHNEPVKQQHSPCTLTMAAAAAVRWSHSGETEALFVAGDKAPTLSLLTVPRPLLPQPRLPFTAPKHQHSRRRAPLWQQQQRRSEAGAAAPLLRSSSRCSCLIKAPAAGRQHQRARRRPSPPPPLVAVRLRNRPGAGRRRRLRRGRARAAPAQRQCRRCRSGGEEASAAGGPDGRHIQHDVVGKSIPGKK